MIVPNDIHLPLSWGWNGDTCAIWGIAIVLGGGAGKIQTARNCEARAEFLTTAANSHAAIVEALKALLNHVDRETCRHEVTHRGGAIWTICDDCGRKWADDRGGFVPHTDPAAVAEARAALALAGETP